MDAIEGAIPDDSTFINSIDAADVSNHQVDAVDVGIASDSTGVDTVNGAADGMSMMRR